MFPRAPRKSHSNGSLPRDAFNDELYDLITSLSCIFEIPTQDGRVERSFLSGMMQDSAGSVATSPSYGPPD